LGQVLRFFRIKALQNREFQGCFPKTEVLGKPLSKTFFSCTDALSGRGGQGDKGVMVLKSGGIENIPILMGNERFISILDIAGIFCRQQPELFPEQIHIPISRLGVLG
jgi:hypothetical protein